MLYCNTLFSLVMFIIGTSAKPPCNGTLEIARDPACESRSRRILQSKNFPEDVISKEVLRHCYSYKPQLICHPWTSKPSKEESTHTSTDNPDSLDSTTANSTILSDKSTEFLPEDFANVDFANEDLPEDFAHDNLADEAAKDELLQKIYAKGVVFLPEVDVQVTNTFWKLYVNISLKPHCDKLVELAENIRKTRDQKKPKDTTLNSYDIDIFTDSLNFSLRLIKDSSELCSTITDTHLRPKRSAPLEFGSQLLQSVFGVARQTDIDSVQADLNHIHLALQNITLADQEQLSILNTTWTRLDEQAQALQQLSNNLAKLEKRELKIANQVTQHLTATHRMAALKASYDRIISAYYQTAVQQFAFMSAVDSILIAAASQKLSRHLISPAKLQLLLTEIQRKLPTGMKLFVPPEKSHVYYDEEITQVLSDDSGFSFIIRLPLQTENSAFQLFSTTALPSKLENSSLSAYVYNIAPFFGITASGSHYIELSHSDFSRCSTGIVKTCPISTAISPISQPSCLSSLFSGSSDGVHRLCSKMIVHRASPLAIRYPSGHTWLLFLPFSLDIHLSCLRFNRFHIKTIQVSSGTYKLQLPGKCQLTTTFFHIPISFQGHSTIDWDSFHQPIYRRRPISSLFSDSQENIIRTLDLTEDVVKHDVVNSIDQTHAVFNATLSAYGERPAQFDHIAAILKSTHANLLQDKSLFLNHFSRQSTWLTVGLCICLGIFLFGLYGCYAKLRTFLLGPSNVVPRLNPEVIPLQHVAFPRPP